MKGAKNLRKEDDSMDYSFLLMIGLVLFSTKALGVLCKKINLPEVVGALLAGVLLGPSAFNVIVLSGDIGTFIEYTAELGVVFLMFSAGLDTDLKELKANLLASVVTAVIGVIVPLVGGFLAYALYFQGDLSNYNEMLKAMFVGVVLTATSVSITVETLREMGKLSGKVGTTILGAAIMDDILGIIVLTIITSMKDPSVNPAMVGVKLLLFAAMILVLFFLTSKFEFVIDHADHMRRVALYSLAFCLFLSFVAEEVFGVADITGAYFAGLMLSRCKPREYIDLKVHNISTMFFSCVFFASIGLKVTIGGMSASIWIFALILTLVAIFSKLVGCGLGAKLCKFTNKEALQIGVGMISRGEVALIVAEKGRQCGLIDEMMFAPIVLVVIVTTIVTPVLLKVVFKEQTIK